MSDGSKNPIATVGNLNSPNTRYKIPVLYTSYTGYHFLSVLMDATFEFDGSKIMAINIAVCSDSSGSNSNDRVRHEERAREKESEREEI